MGLSNIVQVLRDQGGDMSKTRVQLDMSERAVEQLDALRDRLDAASRAEVVRRALKLLDAATADGAEIVLRAAGQPDRVLVVT